MQHRNSQSGMAIEGRIETRLHDVDDLKEAVPEWDDLSKREKYLVTEPPEKLDFEELDDDERELAEMEVEPVEENLDFNTTCVGLHEYIVDNLDPAQAVDKTASHLALGNDASVAPASSDTTLNNEVHREQVTDHADNGNELLASTFIDSTEANGYGLEELGIFTASAGGDLLNHSTFTTVTKDNSKTVTFDVTLTFKAA